MRWSDAKSHHDENKLNLDSTPAPHWVLCGRGPATSWLNTRPEGWWVEWGVGF